MDIFQLLCNGSFSFFQTISILAHDKSSVKLYTLPVEVLTTVGRSTEPSLLPTTLAFSPLLSSTVESTGYNITVLKKSLHSFHIKFFCH